MHIKAADDKTAHLQQLKELLQSDGLDETQHKRLKQQYWRVKVGAQGERDAAHYLDSHFADSPHHAVLHDLRLEIDGQVAQIDHLIVSRGMFFYMLETKQFNGNLCINAFGEFSVQYGQALAVGIESPLEQSRRHERVLRKALELLGIAGRLGKGMNFHHVVLVNPKSQIQRPDPAAFDTRDVIKADQFASWREKHIEKGMGVLSTLATAINFRSVSQLRDMAERLAKLHRPAKFTLPVLVPAPAKPAQSAAPAARFVPTNPSALTPASSAQRQHTSTPRAAPAWQRTATPPAAAAEAPRAQRYLPQQAREDAPQKRLICAHCGIKIEYVVGVFCWERPARFGGVQYCREHQHLFP